MSDPLSNPFDDPLSHNVWSDHQPVEQSKVPPKEYFLFLFLSKKFCQKLKLFFFSNNKRVQFEEEEDVL